MWQKTFARNFNQDFSEPFLPKGFAKAEVREGGILNIRIGDRDADFDADGKCVGAGTALGPCANWPLEPVKTKPAK